LLLEVNLPTDSYGAWLLEIVHMRSMQIKTSFLKLYLNNAIEFTQRVILVKVEKNKDNDDNKEEGNNQDNDEVPILLLYAYICY
jgi:hypothetical protein